MTLFTTPILISLITIVPGSAHVQAGYNYSASDPFRRGARRGLTMLGATTVYAPRDGRVVYNGRVVGDPVLVIAHRSKRGGDSVRVAYVGVNGNLPVGARVRAGQAVGRSLERWHVGARDEGDPFGYLPIAAAISHTVPRRHGGVGPVLVRLVGGEIPPNTSAVGELPLVEPRLVPQLELAMRSPAFALAASMATSASSPQRIAHARAHARAHDDRRSGAGARTLAEPHTGSRRLRLPSNSSPMPGRSATSVPGGGSTELASGQTGANPRVSRPTSTLRLPSPEGAADDHTTESGVVGKGGGPGTLMATAHAGPKSKARGIATWSFGQIQESPDQSDRSGLSHNALQDSRPAIPTLRTTAWVLALLVALYRSGRAVFRRRELRLAGCTHLALHERLEVAGLAAEDALVDGLREDDPFTLYIDLQRVTVADAHALADLNGNNDAPELIDLSNDTGVLHGSSNRVGMQ